MLCRKRIECVCSAAPVARVSDDSAPFAPFALRERLISYIRADLNVLPQTITFTPPLTLILGANGSGKTTIIEVRFPMLSCARTVPTCSCELFKEEIRVSLLCAPATAHVCYSRTGTAHGYVRCPSSQFRLVPARSCCLPVFCDARAITNSIS